MSVLEKPDKFVKLINVLNIQNDIERPHYDFLIGGHNFSLVMQENIDSEEYRKGLVQALEDAFQKNPAMKEFIENKDKNEDLIRVDIDGYRKVRDFLVEVQNEFNIKEIDKAIFDKYGACTNLVEVTDVSLERDTVRLRLNFIDDRNKYEIQHGVLASIPIDNIYVQGEQNKRQAMAEYLEVFMEEYAKNSILQSEVQKFQKKAFLEYMETFDLMADTTLMAKVRDFNTEVSSRAPGIIRARKYEISQRVKHIQGVREALIEEIHNTVAEQKKQENRFFGLGKYYDKIFNKKVCEERKERCEELQQKVDLCEKEEKLALLPSKNLLRFVEEINMAYDKEIDLLTRSEPNSKNLTKEEKRNLVLKYKKEKIASVEVER